MCIFCKIINKEIPSDIVYEDKEVIVFLDIRPINNGHLLVVPKKHTTNLYDTDDKTLSNLVKVIKKTAIALKTAVNADGINIGQNNERAAGQIVDHVHFHVIPRFNNDGFHHWKGHELPKEEGKKLCEKIKNEIKN